MIRNSFIIAALVLAASLCWHHPQAHWQGQLAPDDPKQVSDHLPASWIYKDFVFTPRAQYHIKALVLSKHHYWGFDVEDGLSSYDLALGWGPMSDAKNINRLNISQGFRWYHYSWTNSPPLDPSIIVSHSSNHHIISKDQDVLDAIRRVHRYEVVDLDGYLVDIKSMKNDWSWHTSVSRFDSGDGACKVFWVTSAS